MSEATILVVDDTPSNVKLMRLILVDAGYRVLSAYGGVEALQMVHSDRPDMILLDVRMPGMSGYEVCRIIRSDAEFSTLPVIMVTSLSLSEERIQGIEAGATDFISKPFNKKELLARVRACLASAKNAVQCIVPNLPDAVLITDPDWSIIAVSREASVLLNMPHAMLMHYDFRQQMPQLLPPADCFDFRPVFDADLRARHVAVRKPDGMLIMRVISLCLRCADG